jgi:hypothetical protein
MSEPTVQQQQYLVSIYEPEKAPGEPGDRNPGTVCASSM